MNFLIYPHKCASPPPSSNNSVPVLWLRLWALSFSLNPDRQSPSTSTLTRNTLLLCGLDSRQDWAQMCSTGGLIHQLLKRLLAHQWAKRTHVDLSAKIRDEKQKNRFSNVLEHILTGRKAGSCSHLKNVCSIRSIRHYKKCTCRPEQFASQIN